MRLFDFFRKKKQNPKDETQSIDSSKDNDLPRVKKDIETQRKGYLIIEHALNVLIKNRAP